MIRRRVEIDDMREQRSKNMDSDLKSTLMKINDAVDPAASVVEIKHGAARLQELLGTAKPYEAQLEEVDKIGLNMLRAISRIAAWSDATRQQLHTERNKL
jgi:predicted metal-dependent peptidase